MEATTDKSIKNKLPQINPGDIIRVHQKIKEGDKERIQVFEGIVIKTHRKIGPSATFTVRKISFGIGIERTFVLQSPNIVKIEFKKSSKVRRAKLYYLRNLSGKALRLKEKKVDKDVWELIAKTDAETKPTEEDLAEAVEASAKKEIEDEKIVTDKDLISDELDKKNETIPKETKDDIIEPSKNDTVNEEAENGTEKKDKETKS